MPIPQTKAKQCWTKLHKEGRLFAIVIAHQYKGFHPKFWVESPMPSPNEATGAFLPIIAGTLCLPGRLTYVHWVPCVAAQINLFHPTKDVKHTLARSIGWMMTDAKVAAEPPQTKGSAVLASPMMVGGSAGGGEKKMMRFAKVPIPCVAAGRRPDCNLLGTHSTDDSRQRFIFDADSIF